MARFIAAALIVAAALLHLNGYVEREAIAFAFVVATFVLVVGLEERVERLRENKAQRIMEYTVKHVGLSGDMDQFAVWLEQLNNERWELVCILEPPSHAAGMHYAIFARPKLAGSYE